MQLATVGAHRAVYEFGGVNMPTREETTPVIAWDDEGAALVLDEADGCLVPASSRIGFQRVEAVKAPPAT